MGARRIRDHSRLWCSSAVAAAFAGVVAATASAAFANPDNVTGAAPNQTKPISESARIKELRKRLDERDDLIADLLRRVEVLERQVATRTSASKGPSYTERFNTAIGTKSPVARATLKPTMLDPPLVAQATQPSAPQNPAQPAPEGAAPGQFAVSEEAAQRALERALVQTGAALLPPGKFEFVPSLAYQTQQVSLPGQIALSTTGSVLITDDRIRSTQLQAGTLLRIGLPWDLQAEIGVPFNYKSISNASRVLGNGLSEQTISAVGFGDPTLTLIDQVMTEGDLRPGLFVSGTWYSNLGQTRNHIPLGTGFDEFVVGTTAVKRQDPLVFTAGFAYQTALPNNNIRPGDQFTPSAGLLLAISPETSLRFAQQLTFVSPARLNGRTVPGSEQVQGIFTAGVLSILGRGLVTNFTVGVGETRDAPDLTLQLAFPIRLN